VLEEGIIVGLGRVANNSCVADTTIAPHQRNDDNQHKKRRLTDCFHAVGNYSNIDVAGKRKKISPVLFEKTKTEVKRHSRSDTL